MRESRRDGCSTSGSQCSGSGCCAGFGNCNLVVGDHRGNYAIDRRSGDRTDNNTGSSSQAWTAGSATRKSSRGRGPTVTASCGDGRSVSSGGDRATAADHGVGGPSSASAADHGVGGPSSASAADSACSGGHSASDGYDDGGQFAGPDDRAAQAAAYRSADDRADAGDDDHSEFWKPGAAGAT
jgi:hypothetical protein